MKSLWDALQCEDGTNLLDTSKEHHEKAPDYVNMTGKEFACAVLNSREFRKYIWDGVTLGIIAPGIITRLMDHGWGKPTEHVEFDDVTQRLEDLTPQVIAEKLERVQRMLHLLRTTQHVEGQVLH
jgi:hypothetical protein